jgi:isopentenyl diphosphate isomerase/L-lactate dehydrogenase-like FMN-dependent dehydrogenase
MDGEANFTNLFELEALARDRMPTGAYDYIAGGAEDEVTMRRNRADFERIVLRPRYMVDVSKIDTSTTVLGDRLSMPVLLAPAAGHKLCCPDGELATARAAMKAGTGMVLSTLSTRSMEEVAQVGDAPRWFQLYVYRDREITRQLVQRAEAAGYTALCLTVDVPVIGNRERDLRNTFSFPSEYPFANFLGLEMEAMPTIGVERSSLGAYVTSNWDASVNWSDFEWFRSITRLPIVLKGILTAEDARLAVEHGASGIIVSNHGGRQLDGVMSGIAALPEVVEAVQGRIDVLVDGGVRRGTDVLKALAFGAKAVLVGRPYMFALAVSGEAGVRRVLEILRQELTTSMALTGRPTVGDIDRAVVSMVDG